MDYKKAIDILQPMADNIVLPGVAEALETAIRAMGELPRVEKERDALLEDLRQCARHEPCDYCKHNGCADDLECEYDCQACAERCICGTCLGDSNWEWRGVVEYEEGDANG